MILESHSVKSCKPGYHRGGFTIVESLLLLVIVSLIGFIVYYVYTNAANADAALNKTATNRIVNSTTQTRQKSQLGYVTIPQWGVRAKYDGQRRLLFSISSKQPNIAFFTSDKLNAQGPSCSQLLVGGTLSRYQPNDMVDDGPDRFKASVLYEKSADAKFIKGYFYTFDHSHAPCAFSMLARLETQATNDAVKALLPLLEAIPNTSK